MSVVPLFPQPDIETGLFVGLDGDGDLVFRTYGELDNRTALWILEQIKLSILMGDYEE